MVRMVLTMFDRHKKPCPQSLGCSPWKDSPGTVRISISRKLFLRIIWASFTLDAFEEIALASRRTTEWGTCCMHVRNRRSNGRDEILVQLLLNNLFYISTDQIIFISAVSLHIHIYVVAHLGAKSSLFLLRKVEFDPCNSKPPKLTPAMVASPKLLHSSCPRRRVLIIRNICRYVYNTQSSLLFLFPSLLDLFF